MTLIDALKRHIRNGNLGDDSSPEKLGCVCVVLLTFGCVDMRMRNLPFQSSLTGVERVFLILAPIVGLQRNPCYLQTSSFLNCLVNFFEEFRKRMDNQGEGRNTGTHPLNSTDKLLQISASHG